MNTQGDFSLTMILESKSNKLYCILEKLSDTGMLEITKENDCAAFLTSWISVDWCQQVLPVNGGLARESCWKTATNAHGW